MLESAATYLEVGADDLDADPFLLNVDNGTLDLTEYKNIKLRKHNPKDLITRVSPVKYNSKAECKTWRTFLNLVVPDATVQVFLQRLAGYCLTGSIGEQVVTLLYGTGANGKTTFTNALEFVLGDYGGVIPFASLIHDDRKRGGEVAEGLLKWVTGGPKIKARRLRQDFFEYMPQFKLLLSFNNKPQVRGQDEGIWRRLLLVPFEVTIPKEARDPEFSKKLEAEGSGILNWMLDGYRLWRETGGAAGRSRPYVDARAPVPRPSRRRSGLFGADPQPAAGGHPRLRPLRRQPGPMAAMPFPGHPAAAPLTAKPNLSVTHGRGHPAAAPLTAKPNLSVTHGRGYENTAEARCAGGSGSLSGARLRPPMTKAAGRCRRKAAARSRLRSAVKTLKSTSPVLCRKWHSNRKPTKLKCHWINPRKL